MTIIRELDISICDWETRIILESLQREMARLKSINDTSNNEDEVADAGNDYIEISGLYERLEKEAVEKFGDQIVNFSREPI